MNKLSILSCSTLLACSAAAFAEGFYVQGGGGAGFINGNIDTVGAHSGPAGNTPIVVDQGTVVGSWMVGLGWMFNQSFGVEANYFGYAQATDSGSMNPDPVTVDFDLTTNVYQFNLLGVVRTPFEVGFGFYAKAKAGVGYSHETQEITATVFGLDPQYELENNQTNNKYTPVLGIGIEREMTDLVSVSIEYLAAINNEVENSAVYLAIKFNPYDVLNNL